MSQIKKLLQKRSVFVSVDVNRQMCDWLSMSIFLFAIYWVIKKIILNHYPHICIVWSLDWLLWAFSLHADGHFGN